jgi:[acyl-carrier-protein] S-malonyltransferase
VIAWIFPGQGSQKTSMAAGIKACKDLFQTARSIIGTDLEKLCTTDTDPTWTPEIVQQALYITSVGAARAALDRNLRPQAVAGHSLGEFPALVAAGSLSFEDGARLVDVRGKAMASAGRRNPGGMAAVIGLDPKVIEEICADEGDVWVANLNSPKQTVISGKDRSLASAAEKCLQAGATRVVRLKVPVPSHSPLMEDARTEFETALDAVGLNEPSCPVYCGADGRAHTDPQEIGRLIASAITSRVRFADTIQAMRADGVETFVECGPGKVLRGLVRQIDAGAKLAAIGNDEEAAEFEESLVGSSPQSKRHSPNSTRSLTMPSSEAAVGISS